MGTSADMARCPAGAEFHFSSGFGYLFRFFGN